MKMNKENTSSTAPAASIMTDPATATDYPCYFHCYYYFHCKMHRRWHIPKKKLENIFTSFQYWKTKKYWELEIRFFSPVPSTFWFSSTGRPMKAAAFETFGMCHLRCI